MVTWRQEGYRRTQRSSVLTAVLLLQLLLLLLGPASAIPLKFQQQALENVDSLCDGGSDAACVPVRESAFRNPTVGHLFMDKPLYRPGEVLRFRHWVFDTIDSSITLPIWKTCSWKIHDAAETTVARGQTMHSDGADFSAWRIPSNAKGGQYKLAVDCRALPTAEQDFSVRAFRTPELNIDVEYVRTSYGRGDSVSVVLTVSRADGSALSSESFVTAKASIGILGHRDAAINIDRTPIATGKALLTFDILDQALTGEGSLHVVVEDGGVLEAALVPIPLVGNAVSIEFTPESREDLLLGIENRVFFSASDQAGNQVDIEGQVFESCRDELPHALGISIHTLHEGRGMFSLQPNAHCTYWVELEGPAALGTFVLPTVSTNGASVTLLTDPTLLVAGRQLKARVNHIGLTEGELELCLFRKTLKVSQASLVQEDGEAVLNLPAGLFGVMRLALLIGGELQSERLVFVHPDSTSPLSVDITVDRDVYMPGEEVLLTVKTTDSTGRPTRAMVAVTVTDESGWQLTPLKDRPSRLPERILLTDEVQDNLGGSMRLPDFYSVDDPHDEHSKHLDLLLGTQLWRKSAYKDALRFQDEESDTIKARRMLGLPPNMGYFTANGGHMMLTRGAMLLDGEEGSAMKLFGAPTSASSSSFEGSPSQDSSSGNPSCVYELALDRHARAEALEASIPGATAVFAHKGPGASNGERFDWTQTVYWSASQETDDGGELSVAFKASHSMTTMRVMVDAVLLPENSSQGDGIAGSAAAAFGVSDALFSIREPLYLEPKLPHHMVVGDRVIAPISVNNRGDLRLSPLVELAHIDVGLAAKNAKRNLAIPGIIEGGKSSRLLLDITADGSGAIDFFDGLHATLSLTALDVDELYSDTVSKVMHIVPSGIPVTAESSGSFSSEGLDTVLIDISALRDAHAEGDVVEGSVAGEVKIYPSPITSLVEAVAALLRKPCGCFEQTSSSHFPNIMIAEFLQTMQLDKGEYSELLAETLQHLETGYQRLVSFETTEDGFEWFGQSPPHEALTAYGLLEFAAMKRLKGVHVSDELLSRTTSLLLNLREGDGFSRSTRALDSFGRAPPQVTTAYIVWAMSQSNVAETELKAQIEGLLAAVKADVTGGTANPYVMALLLDSLYNFGRTADAEQIGGLLLAAFGSDGKLLSEENHATITMSRGTSLSAEILSVAAIAMMNDAERYHSRLHACMQQLMSHCKNGSFGGTQATVLSLRAIISYWKLVGSAEKECRASIMVGAIETAHFSADEDVPNLSASLLLALETEQALTLVSDCSNLMFSTSVQWRRKSTPTPGLLEFTFSTGLTREKGLEINEGDLLQLTVNWCNNGVNDTAMLLAAVGIPGGVDVDTIWLDKAVADGRIAFYELASDNSELFLYWRGSQAGQCSALAIPCVATVPGTYTSVPSHFYQYYDDERQIWHDPMEVSILPMQ